MVIHPPLVQIDSIADRMRSFPSFISNQILSPDVPHSLRLQGVLIGGLAIVFDRQQSYLLEDLQEMFKAVKSATNAAHAHELVVRATVQGGHRGRSDAINLNDDLADDLVGGPDHRGLFLSFDQDAFAVPQGSEALQEISDLFLVPSNSLMFESNDQSRSRSFVSFRPQDSRSESEDDSSPTQIKAKQAKNAKKGQKAVKGKPSMEEKGIRSAPQASSPAAGFLGLNLSLNRRPLVHLPLLDDDDRFEPINEEDKDLDLYQFDDYPVQDDLQIPLAVDLDDERAKNEPPIMFEEMEEAEKEEEREEAMEFRPRIHEAPQDEEDSNAQAVKGSKATGVKAKKAAAKKKVSFGGKRSRAIVDDVELLTIRIKDYREWQQDTSDILLPVNHGVTQQEIFRAEIEALKSTLHDINQPLLTLPCVKICPQLSSLYAMAADPSVCKEGDELEDDAEDEIIVKRISKRQRKVKEAELQAGEEPPSHEVPLPPALPSLVMNHVRSSSLISKDDSMFVIEDEARQQDVMYDDEEGRDRSSDHELERVRAVAVTPGGIEGVRMRLDLGGGSDLKRDSKGTATSLSLSHSGLTPEPQARVGEVEGRRRKATGPLSPIQDQDQDQVWNDEVERVPQHFGVGVLEDLMLEESGEVWQVGVQGSFAHGFGRPFTLGTSGPGQDFKLLESSGIEGTQLMSKASMIVAEVIRKRLPLTQSSDAPPAFVSFFELLEGGPRGTLMQEQAVKLFYQLLVLETAGFIRLDQGGSYGDIKIFGGRFLAV